MSQSWKAKKPEEMSLADIYRYGVHVLGNINKFSEWYWFTPLPALGGKRPSEVSLQEAATLLGRIEHGVYS